MTDTLERQELWRLVMAHTIPVIKSEFKAVQIANNIAQDLYNRGYRRVAAPAEESIS